MKFLKKYALFPTRFGLFPYIWLLWLIFPLVDLQPLDTPQKWGSLGLLVIFIWFYRNSYVVTPCLSLWLGGQYVFGLVLTVTNGWGYILMFTAWVVGSLPLSKRQFRIHLVGYELAVVAVLGWVLLVRHNNIFDLYGTTELNVVMLLFLISSPFAAKSVSKSYRRSQQLRQQNSRYALLIKRDERERIARDLHDNLGQSFSMITIKAELANKLLVKHPDRVPAELASIAQASRENLQLVRDIVTGLRQTTVTEVMIQQADALKTAGFELVTAGELATEQWPASVQNVLTSILRESITNAINYSRGDQVQIQFDQTATHYQLRVVDNGCGYDQVRQNAHGIMGMRERLTVANGQLTITSNRHGTTVVATIPREEPI